ncbi:MAG: hypothetical protein IJ190_06555 [Prevotella sp.]|nr:hypothetical protein [Prevotella sp.]
MAKKENNGLANRMNLQIIFVSLIRGSIGASGILYPRCRHTLGSFYLASRLTHEYGKSNGKNRLKTDRSD